MRVSRLGGEIGGGSHICDAAQPANDAAKRAGRLILDRVRVYVRLVGRSVDRGNDDDPEDSHRQQQTRLRSSRHAVPACKRPADRPGEIRIRNMIQLEVDFIYVRLTSTTNIHVYRRRYCLLTYFFGREIRIIQGVNRAKCIIAARADRIESFKFMDTHVC